ncbi:MAG: methyltransferase domain-containing protein [Methanomassiliicoccales archaeon]|nr:MAG: methyltransferase domain-containing protein [Methanomassiliicoccales archaeon]
MSHLNLRAGDNILIVGVGTGEDLLFIGPDIHIVGVDITPSMIKRAKRKIHRATLDLAIMDAENLAFRDGSFDAVVLSLVVTVVNRPKVALDEAVRVVRPGGQVIIFDKFLKGGRLGISRRMLNAGLEILATKINVRAEEIIDTSKVEILMDKPIMMRGNIRSILLRKKPSPSDPGT